MFIRVKKTPNSSKTAVQLVENIRRGKNVKQSIVRHFGYGIDPGEVEALKKIALKYKLDEEQKKTGQPKLFTKDSLLATVETTMKNSLLNPATALPVNLLDIKEEHRIISGIHAAYGKIFDDMSFFKVIKNPARKKASIQLLRNMVMARIAQPASKRSSVQMLEERYGITAHLNAVYRMMDLIDDAAIEKIKTTAYNYVKDLFGEAVNVIFYDCTTLYFESFIEDELKQNGYSKDGKFNQSQVLLAMMVTQSGMPVGYELFEGGKFEGHTLDDALARLHKNYKIDKLIFVADSALLSTENIEKFTLQKQPFIVGARIKNLPADLTKEVLQTDTYKALMSEDEQSDGITYRDIDIKEEHKGAEKSSASKSTGDDEQQNTLRLIVTYSPKRAAKDKHDREKAIESLSKRLEKSKNPTSLLSNFGYKKFVTIQGDAKLIKNEEKIKEAQQWDGLHGIITNIKKDSAQDLLKHYRGLWQIEETFRISKYDLRMRPVFHWIPRRIKAHIAVCFMALVSVRVMEYKVRLQYKKLSPEAIRKELISLQVSILKDYTTKKEYALPSRSSQDAKKIYQLLGLKWTDTPFEIKRKSKQQR